MNMEKPDKAMKPMGRPKGRPKLNEGDHRKMVSIRLAPETIKRLDASPDGPTATIERALERYWEEPKQAPVSNGLPKNGEATKPVRDRISSVFGE